MAWQRNPQDSTALTAAGFILSNAGNPLEGIRLLERALRINPRDPYACVTYTNLANAHLAARAYAKGLEWARRSTTAAPDFAHAYLIMAALQVGLGDLPRAKAALETSRRLAPEGLRIRSGAALPYPNSLAEDGADLRLRFHTFLRVAAGLEAPGAADLLR